MYAENIQSITSHDKQIAALRDFFASKNSEDLQKACVRLGVQNSMQITNWRDVEYEFNRLFIGPMHVPAPPYASVYLDPEPQMMGRTTLEVRELYDELSLATPRLADNGLLPDDHISLELDAVLALLAVEDWCHGLDGPSEVETECRRHLAWLVDHLATWIPQFTEKVRQDREYSAEKYVYDTVIQDTMTVLYSTVEQLHMSYAQISSMDEDTL